MFEQAMENSTLFLADEITLLNQNPILKPIASKSSIYS